METNSTRTFVIRIVLFVLLSLYFLTVFAQPEYDFRNPTLQSGTALQVGAKYKFANVKPSVDAIVTITSMTGGITLTDLDNNKTGFKEAFQPFINVAPLSDGYVEFNIDFVTAGTSTLVSQGYVPVTCIDVDGVDYGDGKLYEKDQVEYIYGYYDFNMLGINLQVLNPPGWITIKNTSAISYPGIDTVAKDVMATVVNMNISSFKVRIGAENTSPSNSEIRYRSVYFQRFAYPSSILLPNRTLISFSGSHKAGGIEIKGTLSASHTYNKLIIERGNSSATMVQIAQINIEGTNSSAYSFTFMDSNPLPGANFYRVKLVNTVQNIYEQSNTLMVKMDNQLIDGIKIYNSVLLQNDPSISLQSNEDVQMTFQLFDMMGRNVYNSSRKIYAGNNNIDFSNLNVARGYFVLVAKSEKGSITKKLIIQ